MFYKYEGATEQNTTYLGDGANMTVQYKGEAVIWAAREGGVIHHITLDERSVKNLHALMKNLIYQQENK